MCVAVKRIEGNGNQAIHHVKDAKTLGETFPIKIFHINNLFSSDILIAGEPTIMGGLTDDDERPITRIENIENSDPNLDPAAALHDSIKAERE